MDWICTNSSALYVLSEPVSVLCRCDLVSSNKLDFLHVPHDQTASTPSSSVFIYLELVFRVIFLLEGELPSQSLVSGRLPTSSP